MSSEIVVVQPIKYSLFNWLTLYLLLDWSKILTYTFRAFRRVVYQLIRAVDIKMVHLIS